MDASVDAPSATIEATAKVEEEVEDNGTTVALAKGGVAGLARTAGRTSLASELGEISLVRIAPKATPVFPCCRQQQGSRRHRQESIQAATARTRCL